MNEPILRDKQLLRYTSHQFSLFHMETEAPNDIATHIHDCYELFYFVSGDLTYYIEGQAYKLSPNDLIITNSRELHRIVFNSKARYERKYIHFKPEYISPYQTSDYNILYNLEKRKLGYFNRIPAKDVIENGIPQLWNNIEETSLNNSPENPILMKSFFVQMLIRINHFLSKNNESLVVSQKYDEKINYILDFINKNLDVKLTLDSLEQEFFVNKYYLCHIFKLNTGFSVFEYITYKRVMKAMELLTSGVKALDVAHAVGFGDYSTFYKAFKKVTGYSPKHYYT